MSLAGCVMMFIGWIEAYERLIISWFMNRSYCQYAKTSKIISNLQPIILSIDAKNSDLSSIINWNDDNLVKPGVSSDLKAIYQSIIASPQYYFVDQVDNLIFTKMGMEVVLIKLGNRGKDRSLYLELNTTRDSIITKFLFLKLALISGIVALTWYLA